jgi:hypothetical protein
MTHDAKLTVTPPTTKVLLRSGGKKSTISGNNGALEHPYLPQVGGFREPSFGNLEARAAKDKSVAADLPGDVESARLCPGAACYCAAQLQYHVARTSLKASAIRCGALGRAYILGNRDVVLETNAR